MVLGFSNKKVELEKVFAYLAVSAIIIVLTLLIFPEGTLPAVIIFFSGFIGLKTGQWSPSIGIGFLIFGFYYFFLMDKTIFGFVGAIAYLVLFSVGFSALFIRTDKEKSKS